MQRLVSAGAALIKHAFGQRIFRVDIEEKRAAGLQMSEDTREG